MMSALPSVPPLLATILAGPVTVTDRIYATDKMRAVCEFAGKPVRRAQGRLSVSEGSGPLPTASATYALELDGGDAIVAGAVAGNIRDAVDLLITRLRHQLRDRETPNHGGRRARPV
jgi:hypothetical protein